MRRMLIDNSSIILACMFASIKNNHTTIEFDGKEVKIPDIGDAYETTLGSLIKAMRNFQMTPIQCVLVSDGKDSRKRRQEFWPEYKNHRSSRPPEFYEVFKAVSEKVIETMLKYGAISVSKIGIEADDIIGALANKVDDCVIFSRDKDLYQYPGEFYTGGNQKTDEIFWGAPKDTIPVIKAIYGDTSDNINPVKGWGEATMVSMLGKFGDDALYDLKDMIENKTLSELEDYVGEFPKFKLILDNEQRVYDAYKVVSLMHPGWDLEWQMEYPEGDGTFHHWEPTQELITVDKLTDKFLKDLGEMMRLSHFNSFDIEGYTTDEGKAWREANKNKQGKMPMDVIGQVMTGFSITTGVNHHKTYYFPVRHKDTGNISLEQAEYILNLFQEEVPTVIQNTQFEFPVIRLAFDLRFDRGWLPQNTHDTMIMLGYVDEEASAGLKQNSERWMGYKQTSYEEVTRGRDMCDLTGKEVMAYGCDDTICTGSLYSLYRLIMDYEETWNCYKECDVTAQFIYAERFVNGIRFDMDKLSELDDENQKKYKEYYAEVQKFLMTLTYEEESDPEPVGRVTIADMRAMKNGTYVKPEAEEQEVVVHRWPGCEFGPATEFTVAEIKRLHKIHTGVELKTRVRNFDKLAAAIEDKDFADCVREENLGGLNDLAEMSFVPSPEINVKSPKQMSKLMYEFLNLPVRIRGKVSDIMRAKGQRQGNPSANEDAIRHAIVYDLKEDKKTSDFLKTMIEVISCRTQDGLYFKPYKNMPHYSDGMVHPQFKISAQKSGRGTAAGPNDMQITKNGDIRQVYCPYDDDYVWVSLDFSSQELAHIAWHSQDENMLKCFTGDWEDIHSKTGAGIYNLIYGENVSYEEFNERRKTEKKFKDVRNKKAKAGNFRKTYDGSAPGLAVDLLCSEKEAEEIIEAFSSEFPGVDEYINKMKEINRERGYAVTPMGRRKHLWRVLDGGYKDNHELRSAGNHPIQGGSASQIKLVLRKFWELKIFEKYDAFFAGTVHDETNALVRRSDVVEFIREVHPIVCQKFLDFGIDFRSSIEIGKNFGSLTEIGSTFDEEAIKKVLESI